MNSTYTSFGMDSAPLCRQCGKPLGPNEVKCLNCGWFNVKQQSAAVAPSLSLPSLDQRVAQFPFPTGPQGNQFEMQLPQRNLSRSQLIAPTSRQSGTLAEWPTAKVRIPGPLSPAVLFEEVTCQIGKRRILDQISLSITRGEITGLLGPNGAGKTTLLSSIMGLRHPSSGTITVLDEKLPSRSVKLRQKIGVVLQETALYDELTTLENLRFAASLYAIANPKQRISEVLELLTLTNRAHDKVRNLSGGLQRRVTIARALLHSPTLLIIDEPTLGVDVEARHAIWSHLRLLRSTGTTILVSTNYLDEALALCDTVAVLRSGKLLITDTPDALVARAGSCLDVECIAPAGEAIMRALTRFPGILRVNQTPTGLSIFLRGNMVSDNVIRIALQTASIKGFRTRGADLAEVFHALEGIAS